jgi:CelD/BcsL family acetyltransferase involved in cellulose biosynthesis
VRWTFAPAADFERHLDAWRRLSVLADDTPLLDPAFVAPLLREFGTGQEVLAMAGEPAAPPCAMLLLTRVSRLGWSTFQPSQAPVGLVVREPSLDGAALLRGLLRALPGLPLVVALAQQDPDFTARPPDHGAIRTLDYIRTARVAVAGSFDDYWKARGRNLRRNLKRQRNGLERRGIRARLEVLTLPEEVAGAIADYGSLESAGWKAGLGTAIHPDNAQGRYYRTILESFCRNGEGRIYKYWYGDRLVAMDLCLHRSGVLIILKTTYDETIESSSPAMLMRHEAFEGLFAEGTFRRIEFYGKVMDWHTKWSDDIRTLFHVNCARWPALWTFRGAVDRWRRRPAPPVESPRDADRRSYSASR